MEILGIFELFFLLWFPLEKCLLVQSAFSAALVGGKNFEKNKLDFGFEIFHIFYAKKRPFLSIFGPPDFFFRYFTIFFAPKKIAGLVPPHFDGPVNFFRKIFHFFLRKFVFLLKEKKRGAAGAEKKNDAEAPQAPRKNIKKNIFYIFLRFFFWKNNLAKFWKFWEFLSCFFYYGLHWKSVF